MRPEQISMLSYKDSITNISGCKTSRDKVGPQHFTDPHVRLVILNKDSTKTKFHPVSISVP